MAISVLAILSTSSLDLISRIITSIDYDINKVIVLILEATLEIVNSTQELLLSNSYIGTYIIYYSFQNAGLAKGKNYIINNNIVDYIIFADENIYFPPNFLKKLDDYLTQLGTLNGIYQFKMYTNNSYLPSKYDFFIYTLSSYRLAGLFDENFYPRFIDEKEFDLRFLKLNGKKTTIHNIFVYFDFETFNNYTNTKKRILVKCEGLNWQYFMKKWKINNIYGSYRFPFNDPYKSINIQYSDAIIISTQKAYLGSYINPPIYTLVPSVSTSYVFTLIISEGDIYLTLNNGDIYLSLIDQPSF